MKKLISLALAFLLNLPTTAPGNALQTPTLKQRRAALQQVKKPRLAPDLEEMLTVDDQKALTLGQIRQIRLSLNQSDKRNQNEFAEPRIRINGLTLPTAGVPAEEKQSFIVQVEGATPKIVLQEKLALLGARISQWFDQSGMLVLEAPRAAIRQIAADSSVAYISPDRIVKPMGFVEDTTGTTLVRSLMNGSASLDGDGIGMAILDSGIYNAHNAYVESKQNNIVFSKDFTGENDTTNDFYGHGSHVATLASGSVGFATHAYRGIANKARVLNLRVLDSNGMGSASTIIAAIDWCIANKAIYNLRVINLSLGTGAKDSYQYDPLCQAARRAHNAGIVVVAAAGNAGKDATGKKVYGGIHSPGIDPSVITVGAANTMGTVQRSDDVVTTYSSRGPTRGYITDTNGVKHYDNLIKPDLIAPGNRLIAAQSAGKTTSGRNTLIALFPALDTNATSTKNNKTMYLSGTSMSAPVVAGAAALLLQLNPNLTPGLVKAILMYTAQPLKNFNTLEQGAGLLNVDGAARMAKIIKSKTSTLTNGATMITTKSLPAQTSSIAGETCYWGKGVITNYGFLYGDALMTNWQEMYGQGVVFADATFMANGVLTRSTTFTSGTSITLAINSGAITTTGNLLANGVVFADGMTLGDGNILGDGIILGDGLIISDSLIWGDSVAADHWMLGDPTAAMLPIPLR